jgi:hypothetical protein
MVETILMITQALSDFLQDRNDRNAWLLLRGLSEASIVGAGVEWIPRYLQIVPERCETIVLHGGKISETLYLCISMEMQVSVTYLSARFTLHIDDLDFQTLS